MTRKIITWKQFKELVEAAGVQDDEPIAWIDWNAPYAVLIERYTDGEIQISGSDARAVICDG